MTQPPTLARRLTSRRGAWLTLLLSLVVLGALLGAFSRADAPDHGAAAPPDSESAQVDALLAAEFPDVPDTVLIVATRDDGSVLDDGDLASLSSLASVVDSAGPPIVSDDGAAAVLVAPVTTTETATAIADLRAAVGDQDLAGMTALVTGGPAFGADVAAAFDGADITLLLVTIAIAALILIVTYRSPLLWLAPLLVVGLADQAAAKVTAAAGQAFDLHFDTGIISVLVFGAGTNYALLLISRYREELLRHDDHRTALAVAWRASAPAIVASNVTVVLALGTLLFAVIPGTRGLGGAAALGLALALAAVLFMVPAVLAIIGRRAFWPFVPRPGAAAGQGGVWRRIATGVTSRSWVSLGAGLALLGVMTLGLIGTSVGLTQIEKFRVPSESAAGLTVLGEHFPAGQAQPMVVVASTEHAADVSEAIAALPGVVHSSVATPSTDGGLTQIIVTGEPAPGTPAALELVAQVRQTAHEVPGAQALVGGAVATDVDARAGNERDLVVLAPLVLAVVLAVLLVLLRAVLAPVLLLVVNLASAAAAVGAGAWLSRVLLDQHALDLQVPLLSFLFLVALGVDYTIFLVHRIRSGTGGTRAATVDAIAHTGTVITSAGIVLAAVFAALGVLPLVTLGQLGLIVGVGVVVDTVVVRTVVVPALFTLLGERMWWPGRRAEVPTPQVDAAA